MAPPRTDQGFREALARLLGRTLRGEEVELTRTRGLWRADDQWAEATKVFRSGDAARAIEMMAEVVALYAALETRDYEAEMARRGLAKMQAGLVIKAAANG